MQSQSRCLQVLEYTLSHDSELVQQVVARFLTWLGSRVRNFQMTGRDDGLILRGEVNTYYGKQVVQEVVMDLSGLSILSNEIEVHCCRYLRCVMSVAS